MTREECRNKLEARQAEVESTWLANDGGLTWAASDELSDVVNALRHLEKNNPAATRKWLGEDWEDQFDWSEPLEILAEWAFESH